MTGRHERGARQSVGERLASCGFPYMGQRGAQGQSLRASWQWQHQYQTLEEERTCMMVNLRYESMAAWHLYSDWVDWIRQ